MPSSFCWRAMNLYFKDMNLFWGRFQCRILKISMHFHCNFNLTDFIYDKYI